MQLSEFRTFGQSGLVVSPLALGTMTFGTQRWGSDQAQSFEIFKYYYENGGNFIDTANVYSGGTSETLTGKFIRELAIRDEVVLATKAGFSSGQHPHAGGNGRKHIHTALNQSLQRLDTDYIDLFWIHMWDRVTPPEEVLLTVSALIQAGKIRYWGLSNVPAWYAAKIITLARTSSLPAPIALQLEYSLVERSTEQEHLPLARNEQLAVQPWSPLGGGFLTGKYDPSNANNVAGKRGAALPDGAPDQGTEKERLSGDNPFGDSKFTEKNWAILNTVKTIAKACHSSPAQIALNWLTTMPGVQAPIIGASKLEQVKSNIAALSITLDDSQKADLLKASQPTLSYPSSLFNDRVQKFVFGGVNVTGGMG
ncbi:aldo/keto reductase [Reinekea blandensis]|uniref:Probable oxidoreductase n=1 Tax=Reinekea blandensis MED297 TaxID=314283 RepID=A4BBU5_9GAMM|nr:aldo/keto reductase [Reinekea blandensis]EAR10430.1 probable oxidoreductase [Reinekea sp. MED297] [Reinekea blandensis MED297]